MAAGCTRPTHLNCSDYVADSLIPVQTDANPDVSGIGIRHANDECIDRSYEN